MLTTLALAPRGGAGSHRAYLRLARMSVAMAVAEANHHTAPRGLKTARAEKEVEEQVKYNAPRRQKAPPPGMRPASLVELQGSQVVFERDVAEQVHDAPVVPIFAASVPHMVDQLDVLKILGIQLLVFPEQVIEVPTISMPSRCSRTVLSAPQMAEQLVEVPTVLSHALKRTHTHTLAEIHGQTQTNRHTKQIHTSTHTSKHTLHRWQGTTNKKRKKKRRRRGTPNW